MSCPTLGFPHHSLPSGGGVFSSGRCSRVRRWFPRGPEASAVPPRPQVPAGGAVPVRRVCAVGSPTAFRRAAFRARLRPGTGAAEETQSRACRRDRALWVRAPRRDGGCLKNKNKNERINNKNENFPCRRVSIGKADSLLNGAFARGVLGQSLLPWTRCRPVPERAARRVLVPPGLTGARTSGRGETCRLTDSWTVT